MDSPFSLPALATLAVAIRKRIKSFQALAAVLPNYPIAASETNRFLYGVYCPVIQGSFEWADDCEFSLPALCSAIFPAPEPDNCAA
jgi:hypothetical protein